jgi:hypothetical protein
VGYQLGSDGPTDRSAGLLIGRTHLSGTAVSLVGGDLGVPMSHTHYANSKALKLQSVSPIYNAQQGGLDVADARGGA